MPLSERSVTTENIEQKIGAVCAREILTLLAFFAAVFLPGCTTTAPERIDPELGENVNVPNRWTSGIGPTEIQIADAWWEEFGDRELTALIHESIAHNHDLKAAAGRIQTAAAEGRIASADLVPTLSAGFDGARRQQVTEPATLGLGSDFGGLLGSSPSASRNNSFGVSLNTSWELDIWGRIRKGLSAAYGDLEASEAEYAAKAISLAGQTAKAWFALTEARLQHELAETTSENYRKTAKQAEDRVEGGVQSPTDEHLAKSNLASAEALVEQRNEAVRRASRQLEVLVGRYPSGRSRGAGNLPGSPNAPPSGIPAEIIRRRPDLIAAERRVAATGQRVGAAKAALYPRLSITGSGGRSSTDIDNLLDGNFNIWSIAGNVVQPIFEGGRLRAQVSSVKGKLKDASETFAQQVLVAYGEVETALSLDEVLARRESKLREAAESAAKAADIGGNRYDQGVETFLVVLESQRRTLDAESALISARRARLDNRVDLHLALGGGFKSLVR